MSAISNYRNVFNEPATMDNLSHIFDILNERNEERIVYRDFTKHMENVGIKLDAKAMRKVYDHIASSVKKQRYVTKETWTKAINIAHQHADTRLVYEAILSGKQYDPQPARTEIELNEINMQLKDTSAAWVYRIQCMESLCRQLTSSKIKKDKFHELFRTYHVPLTKQAKDRRSNVSRVACESFAKIILKWKQEFLKYSAATIAYLFELVRQKIQIVHESGMNAIICLLKNVGDHKKDLRIMDVLGAEATTSKFVNLQKDCFDLLLLYVAQQSAALKRKDEFWLKLLEYTAKGVNDTADVRNSALMLLAEIESERPQLCMEVVSKMSIHLKKRYEEEYKYNFNESSGTETFEVDDEKKESKQKKQNKTYKINKRPKDDISDVEPEEKGQSRSVYIKKKKKQKTDKQEEDDDELLLRVAAQLQQRKEEEQQKKEGMKIKEKEKQQRLKQKKARKEEKEKQDRLKQERKRKEEERRIKEREKDMISTREKAKQSEKDKVKQAKKDREQEKVYKQIQTINKIKDVEKRKNKLDEMRRLEREQRLKEEKKKLAAEKKQNKKREKIRKHNKKIIEQEEAAAAEAGSAGDDDYGFPNVHFVFTEYFEEKGIKCATASELVLYAKDKGYGDYGITFGKVSKYLKADYKANK